jgi:hypothetical protein
MPIPLLQGCKAAVGTSFPYFTGIGDSAAALGTPTRMEELGGGTVWLAGSTLGVRRWLLSLIIGWCSIPNIAFLRAKIYLYYSSLKII